MPSRAAKKGRNGKEKPSTEWFLGSESGTCFSCSVASIPMGGMPRYSSLMPVKTAPDQPYRERVARFKRLLQQEIDQRQQLGRFIQPHPVLTPPSVSPAKVIPIQRVPPSAN